MIDDEILISNENSINSEFLTYIVLQVLCMSKFL